MAKDGSAPISEYLVEWYSEAGQPVIQRLTISAANGVAKNQAMMTSADSVGITGYFILAFGGETAEPIAHDVEADGTGSVEMKE